MQWLSEYWNDIKGNVKYTIAIITGTAVVSGIVAITHGLLPWQQAALAAGFVFMFGWALLATALNSRHSLPREATEEKERDSLHGAEVDLLKNAPQLVIQYRTAENHNERLVFVNDGSNAIVSVKLGPLTWKEEREIGLVGSIGTLLANQQQDHPVWIMDTPKSASRLFEFMRECTPPEADTSVTAYYEDSRGAHYSRDFLLTTQVMGSIIWKPGPIRLQHS